MLFFNHAKRNDFYPHSLSDSRIQELKLDIQGYLTRDIVETAQTDVPNVWKYPLEPDVIGGLAKLSGERCAFCERMSIRLDSYRFRPPAYALSDGGAVAKPCYLWLAFNWDNFFPICDECTPARKNYFPVIGKRVAVPDFNYDVFQGPGLDLKEDHVLYYPGQSRIAQAFQIRLDGHLTGNSKAEPTIAHFSLNRPALIDERAAFLEQMIDELLDGPSGDQNYSSLYPNAPYPSAAYLLALRVGREVKRQTKQKINLSPLGIGPSLARLWRDTEAHSIILRAIEEVRQQDENRSLPDPVASIEETLPKPQVDLNQPRIKHVRIQNFKSLESIEFSMKERMPELSVAMSVPNEFSDVPDAPCLLILGENATGKSSVLEAIALTCIPTILRDQLGEKASDLLLDPEYMGSAEHEPINHGFVEVEFYGAPSLKLVLNRLNGTLTDESHADHPLIFAYGAHRLFDREQRDSAVRHIDTLFKRDRQISNPEPWLIQLSNKSPESLNEVVSALRHIIQIDGQFRNIEIERDDNGNEYCAIYIQRTNPVGMLKQRLSVVSSGYRAVVAVVCDIFSRLLELAKYDPRAARHARAIILIDEIEAHLHPRWKMQIVSGLRRALPRSTFIFTSHDPLCLRGMFDGEVMMLNRFRNRQGESDSRMNEVVEQISDFSNIESLTIDQLLTSDIFQLFTTDDRRIEATFAEVPAILKKEKDRQTVTEREQTILRAFRQEISDGMPYGKTEVARAVQEAVAEYIAERRDKDKKDNNEARERAKDAVKNYLREVLE
ncbi:AAA family ATPase [Mesorhizobium sp. YC-39]|uniref:AAA family ATPase n=1 Tax=unclassified Mesorhizobium TaxID=325217 RepID=UPI0021E8846A|nr:MULTISPECIES: AAA family ATPase [unclassified Mesorhizobium]MCV3211104.1 AAA family ATPase [Mesorhizobium sp. YC-2]MCV3232829.1 AAA family ATPase [Mesorhizobium sp. YC-39]